MFPGVFGDGAVLALRAVVWCIGVDATPEEGPATVTSDGTVVNVIVGHVSADLTRDFANELGSLPFWLSARRCFSLAEFVHFAAGGELRRRPRSELAIGKHFIRIGSHAGQLVHNLVRRI